MCDNCDMVNRMGKEIGALSRLIKTEPTEADFTRAFNVLKESDPELTLEMLQDCSADRLSMLIAVRAAVAASCVYDDKPPLAFMLGAWAGEVMETEVSLHAALKLMNFTPGMMN